MVNCWQFLSCEEYTCPVHGKEGLICWLVPGTRCHKKTQGRLADKIEMCCECKVFSENLDPVSVKKMIKLLTEQLRGQENETSATNRELFEGLSKTYKVLRQLHRGDPTARLTLHAKNELLQKLELHVNEVAMSLNDVIDQYHELAIGICEHYDVLNKISAGDMSAKASEDSGNELVSKLGKLINKEASTLVSLIDEQKHIQEALKESESTYKAIFEATGSATMIIEEDTTISLSNKECEKIFGYAKEEMEGKSWTEFVSEQDMEKMRQYHAMRRINPDMAPASYECRLYTKQRELRDYFLTVAMIPGTNRSVVSVVDITERKKTRWALIESEKRLMTVLNSIQTGVLVIDVEQHIIIDCNDEASRMIGLRREDIIGHVCHKFICPSEQGRCPITDQHQTIDNSERMVLKPGGEMIPVIKSVVPVTMGERKCLIESFTDITERKRLEAQLQHVQKMEAIGTLAGGVAHDFNNILTAIIGYAHILLMKMGKDDPLRTNIDQILASSNRAANLTQGLLAFSRKQAIDTRPVEVNEIVRSVEKLLLQVIGEDIEFRTFFTETPLVVMADKGQIEQVLMNLCTNARDAMPHGGILSISMEMIRLDSEFINMHGYGKKGDYAHISVVDTGVGMDDITKEKIFEPFFTTKEVGKGTGLGMAIVYGIIKQHNGFIDIYSAIGKGSTFNIYLPLIKAKSVDDEKIAEDIIAGGTETILFAEDDTVVRGLIAEVLTDSGYKVIEAINGEDAVRKFKEHGPAISLLLFDVIMPKKHGVDAYLEILPERPDIKVLFISGYSRDVIQMRWVHEHGHQCLQKPISPAELQKKLREILDEKQGEIS